LPYNCLIDSEKMTKKNKPQSRFLSLKWSLLITFGCLLSISHAAQYLLSYHQLTNQFNQQRQLDQQHQLNLVRELLEQSSRLMEQAAETIPTFTANEPLLTNKPSKQLNQYWNHQQANWGLSAAYQYNRQQQLTMHWGLPVNKLIENGKIDKAFQNKQPLTVLSCAAQCFQLVYIPTLTGVSVLVRSIADIIFAFEKITGNDLAILKPILSKPDQNKVSLQLTASSHPQEIRQVFDRLITQDDMLSLFEKEVVISLASKKIGVQLFHLTTEPRSTAPVLLFASNLTEKYQGIESARKHNLQIILIALAFSALVIFSALMRYSKRIISVSSALPALSKGAYRDVRNALKKNIINTFSAHRDEVDSLIESTLLVSRQLESSQKKIDINTQLLKTQNNKISKYNQYITDLLNTAPVIILSQTTTGEISSINRLGCELLVLEASQIINRQFDDFFTSSNNTATNTKLDEFRKTPIGSFDAETVSKQPTQDSRTIAWIHKSIHSQSDTPLILSIGQDITQRKIAEEHLLWLVDHDSLTNLYNRRYFQHMFEQQLKVAERYQETGAILFFDLDQFKYINDTSGHQAGDQLLIIISNTLQNIVRTSDTLARLGGDEFAILVPETDVAGAITLAKKILEQLKNIDFNPSGQPHKVSASIGISLFPEAGSSVADFMANADIAMYHAKESGRSCWHVFTLAEQAREQLTKQVLWKERIESAIQQQRFVMHYQPILDIKTQKISHAEALIRMIDADGELIMPNNFIPAAEKTGLINHIDIIALTLAFNKLSSLGADNNPLKLSVNLSGKAFNNPYLLGFLIEQLNRNDIDAKKLIIEVTETTAIENFSAAIKMMSEVSAKGAKFALDDFGIGFSSFQHLRQLPVDYIKIDGAFIRQLDQREEDRILVKAITDIAKASGKKTIAEFVENAAIMEKIETFGIDYAQGYHIAKPSADTDY